MILAEPPRTQFDLNFRLLGIPLRVHPLFWLIGLAMGPWNITPAYQAALLSAMWIAAMFLCIVLHELGHAVVLKSFGYQPWIVLHSFGGLAIHNPGQLGARRPGPLGQILVSLAGPGAGFILVAVMILAFKYVGDFPVRLFQNGWRDVVPAVDIPEHIYLTIFLHYVFEITVLWGLMNLLPVYPLDGGQIAKQVLLLTNPHDAVRQSLMLSTMVAAIMVGVAVVRWNDTFIAVLFGWLAYSSFSALQSYHHDHR